MTIGQKIRMVRRALGWYQHELAKEVGVEPPTVSRWENDEMRPNPKMLVKIAEELGKPPDFFEDETPERDLTSIQARLEKLEQNEKVSSIRVPDEFVAAWRGAEKEEWRQGLAMFFLTGDPAHLSKIRPEMRRRLEKVLDFHHMNPSEKTRAPKR